MMKHWDKKWGGGFLLFHVAVLLSSSDRMALFITQVQWRSEQLRRGFTAIVDGMSINIHQNNISFLGFH